MTVFKAGQSGVYLSGSDDSTFDEILNGHSVSESSTPAVIKGPHNIYITITGTSLGAYDSLGIPHSGTITGFSANENSVIGPLGFSMTSMHLSASTFASEVSHNDTKGFLHAASPEMTPSRDRRPTMNSTDTAETTRSMAAAAMMCWTAAPGPIT